MSDPKGKPHISEMREFRMAIHPPAGTAVEWLQPSALGRFFTLVCGDSLLATLEFTSPFGSLAKATCSEGCWTFKRVGFFNTRVSVRNMGEETDLGIYHPRWTGSEGRLDLQSGASFTWRAANFLASRYVWTDTSDSELITYHSGAASKKLRDAFKNQARIEIAPAQSLLTELSLLALLGWYLIQLTTEDSTAVIATMT